MMITDPQQEKFCWLARFAGVRQPRHWAAWCCLALLPFAVGGCTISWPEHMAVVTYSGRVVDRNGRPAAGAGLTFERPGKRLSKNVFFFSNPELDSLLAHYPADILAETTTRPDGTFQATTGGGYATRVGASKGRQYAIIGQAEDAPARALPHRLLIRLATDPPPVRPNPSPVD